LKTLGTTLCVSVQGRKEKSFKPKKRRPTPQLQIPAKPRSMGFF